MTFIRRVGWASFLDLYRLNLERRRRRQEALAPKDQDMDPVCELDETPIAEVDMNLDVVKRHAKRLARWTDLTLSEAQEVTALVYGSTSWQALQKIKTIRPDEALDYREQLARTGAQIHVLSRALRVCLEQAAFLLNAWGATRIRPNFCSVEYEICSEIDLESGAPLKVSSRPHSLKVLVHCPSEVELPTGFKLALVFEHQPKLFEFHPTRERNAPGEVSVVLVKPGRLARYVEQDDVVPLEEALFSQPLRDALNQFRTGGFDEDSKEMKTLLKQMGRRKAFGADTVHWSALPKVAPVRTTARWLTEPLSRKELMAAYLQYRPWRQEDHPLVLAKGDSFFCVQYKGYYFTAKVSLEVYLEASTSLRRFSGIVGHVAIGVGSITYKEASDRGWQTDRPGYYLCKYGNQDRGDPFLEFEKADAEEVSGQFGLQTWKVREQRHFFTSPAFDAMVSWIATYPAKGKLGRGRDDYVGSWLKNAVSKMEWDLARAYRV